MWKCCGFGWDTEKCWHILLMFFMSSSVVLSSSNNFIQFFKHKQQQQQQHLLLSNSFLSLQNSSPPHASSTTKRTRRLSGFISKAEKHNNNSSKRSKTSWWQKFFSEDDGNWLGLKEDDMAEEQQELSESEEQQELSEDEKFEAWKQRAEAIIELREAQEDTRNQEARKWEDWLLEEEVSNNSSWERGIKDYREEVRADDSSEMEGIVRSVRSLIFGREQNDDNDDDILYEDRVFQYASSKSAKFLALLIIIPWAIDFLVHDYVFMPFLDRYVKTVPLAAQMLDVRRHQKLEIIEELRIERGRFELEVEIGKSPPLSDNEVWWELRNKALELRDEWRLENRRAFANIWSDTVYGISLFILLYFNKSKVALLKFTGYKIINNISDTGKAFLIILITDIFLGYHSESGWETLLEIIVDHYGLVVDQAAITIFVCVIPVTVDACVKLWLFKFLPRLSPKVMSIFQEMKRH